MIGLSFIFLFMGAVALLAIIAFEVYMFLDVLKNPGLSDNERIIWVLGMFLLHPVIAIVYYFVAHSRLNTHPE